MMKRTAVRIATFSAALVLVLGAFAVNNGMAAAQYRMKLEYTYERALNELAEELSNIDTALEKIEYASGTQMLERLTMELTNGAGTAKAAIETLPFSDNRMERVSRFLSQVGDYALSLSAKASSGQEISEKEVDNLVTMSDYAHQLTEAFEEVQTMLSDGQVYIGETEAAIANLENMDEPPAFDDGLDELAETFSAYPELLYDGPFSDHINQKEAAFIQGKAEIDEETALQTAAKIMDYDAEYLTYTGKTENTTLPTYNFTCVDKAVRVSVYGGEVVSYENYIAPADTLIFHDEALESAREFLKKMGLESMQESYYATAGNVCTINFAWVDPYEADGFDGVICYPDLIKVSVSMETGEVIEYNATGFFMNHHERTMKDPAITQEEAAKTISSRLEIKSTKLAIIPSPGLYELFCYEFTCQNRDGQDVLVYVNTETGVTEQIYLVTKSDGGVLAQ